MLNANLWSRGLSSAQAARIARAFFCISLVRAPEPRWGYELQERAQRSDATIDDSDCGFGDRPESSMVHGVGEIGEVDV
jgi:hypothetical protein